MYSPWLAPNKLMDHLDALNSLNLSFPFDVVAITAKDNVKGIYGYINDLIEENNVVITNKTLASEKAGIFVLLQTMMSDGDFIEQSESMSFLSTYVALKLNLFSTALKDEDNYDVTGIKNHVYALMLQKKKVILVSHSEGSFIASKVHKSLAPHRKYRIGAYYIAPGAANID